MHYQLKNINGIDCLFAPMADANSITIDISIKAGSCYESETEAGISHFLEHMFFKWGAKRKTPLEVAMAMDSIGAYFNASTGKENTSYYVKSAPQFATFDLQMLADMLINATFQEPEMQREKGVVIQELKMYEDRIDALLYNKWSQFFIWGAFGREIIGYEENIKNFTRDQLFAYKNALYTKDNLLITIAGKILDQQALEEQISSLFATLPSQKTRQKPEFHRNLPSQASDFFQKNAEQPRIIISMPGYSAEEEYWRSAKVLTTILGGNMSSRLFQNIREKLGLCYSISAGHRTNKEYGVFVINAGLDKEYFDLGVQKIHEELDHLIQESFSDQELENAKNALCGSLQMGIESSDEMAEFLSDQQLNYGKIETLEETIARYQELTRADVEQLFPHLTRDKRRSYHIQ